MRCLHLPTRRSRRRREETMRRASSSTRLNQRDRPPSPQITHQACPSSSPRPQVPASATATWRPRTAPWASTTSATSPSSRSSSSYPRPARCTLPAADVPVPAQRAALQLLLVRRARSCAPAAVQQRRHREGAKRAQLAPAALRGAGRFGCGTRNFAVHSVAVWNAERSCQDF